LGDHLAAFEAGNKIHPIDQDPDVATAELVQQLRKYHADVEMWLLHLPVQAA